MQIKANKINSESAKSDGEKNPSNQSPSQNWNFSGLSRSINIEHLNPDGSLGQNSLSGIIPSKTQIRSLDQIRASLKQKYKKNEKLEKKYVKKKKDFMGSQQTTFFFLIIFLSMILFRDYL